jgi:hypothetical protein
MRVLPYPEAKAGVSRVISQGFLVFLESIELRFIFLKGEPTKNVTKNIEGPAASLMQFIVEQLGYGVLVAEGLASSVVWSLGVSPVATRNGTPLLADPWRPLRRRREMVLMSATGDFQANHEFRALQSARSVGSISQRRLSVHSKAILQDLSSQ